MVEHQSTEDAAFQGRQLEFGQEEPVEETAPPEIDTAAIAAAGDRRSHPEPRISQAQADLGGGHESALRGELRPTQDALTPEALNMPARPQRLGNWDGLRREPIRNDDQLRRAQSAWDQEYSRRQSEAYGPPTPGQKEAAREGFARIRDQLASDTSEAS